MAEHHDLDALVRVRAQGRYKEAEEPTQPDVEKQKATMESRLLPATDRLQLDLRTRGGFVGMPEQVDANRFAQKLFTPLPGRYDRLAELLSVGQNGRWRRANSASSR